MALEIVKLVDSPVHLNFTGGITPKGAYIAETTYNTGESVSYLGSSYVAIQETTGNLPTNTTYWQLLSLKGDGGTSGGTTGQVLAKASNADFDNEWKTLDPDDLDDTSTTNKFVTTAEKGIWNGKQDALGFTPENVASKKITLTDSDSDYPTTRAVNTALSSKITWGGDNTASKGLIGTTSNQPIGFITNNTEKMTILANGNVGIGTTNPLAKLEINNQATFNTSTPGLAAYYGLHFNGQVTADYATGITWNGGASGTQAGLYVQGSSAYGTKMYFATTDSYAVGARTRMMIDYIGNVGIGTTTPSYKLDVVGSAQFSVGDGALRILKAGSGYTAIYYNRIYNSEGFNLTYYNGSSETSGIKLVGPTGNVGIGTTAPNQQLEITKNFRLPATVGTDAYGVIYKNGNRFIHDFNYGNNGTVTTAGQNTFLGVNAGNFTMGSTAYSTSHSSYNTGIGVRALVNNTTGHYNSAIGMQALLSNTTGYYNSAIGGNALLSNTTGSNNSAIGVNAGLYLSDGTTGRETGNNGLYLGSGSKASANGTDNEIVIGYNAIGKGSNTVTIGNTSILANYFSGQLIPGKISSAPTAIEGGIYFNSTDKHFYGYNGTDWKQLDN